MVSHSAREFVTARHRARKKGRWSKELGEGKKKSVCLGRRQRQDCVYPLELNELYAVPPARMPIQCAETNRFLC
jgi:hypothetical protein